MTHILTRREVLQEVPIDETTLNSFIANQVLKPARVFEQKYVFFRRHIEECRKIIGLLRDGVNITQLKEVRDRINLDTATPQIILNVISQLENMKLRRLELIRTALTKKQTIELYSTCKNLGIRNISKLNKNELVEFIMRSPKMENILQDLNIVINIEGEQEEENLSLEEQVRGMTFDELKKEVKRIGVVHAVRMNRQQLETCLLEPERREEITEQVRQELIARKNTATTVRQERNIGESNIPQQVEPEEITQEIETDEVLPFEQNTTTTEETIETEEVLNVEELEVTEEPIQEQEEVIIQETPAINGNLVSPELNLTREQMAPINIKVLAGMIGQSIPNAKYYRRMEKEELILFALHPELRQDIMNTALDRYNRYNQIRYGRTGSRSRNRNNN